MNFHVLTLFPEMIEQGINTSITGRAIEKGLISLNAINIRDYAGNKAWLCNRDLFTEVMNQ